MRKHVISTLGIVAATAVFLTAMLVTDPLRACRELVLRVFHAAQYENAIVPESNLYQDPRTQETSHGQHPLQSLTTLAEFWAANPSGQRVYFMGNSQMYSIVLPPTEQTASGMDRTYPDMVFAHYASDSQSKMLFYRLAAWNIDYMECLWYLNYILSVPELRPNRILLQLTFQTFRLVGIRDGMLELLADPRFRSAITAEARAPSRTAPRSRKPWSGTTSVWPSRRCPPRGRPRRARNGRVPLALASSSRTVSGTCWNPPSGSGFRGWVRGKSTIRGSLSS